MWREIDAKPMNNAHGGPPEAGRVSDIAKLERGSRPGSALFVPPPESLMETRTRQ